MKKSDVVTIIVGHQNPMPVNDSASAYAPTNIALCKYWGKRNAELNLPMTSSLSIALADKGSTVFMKLHDKPEDHVSLNGTPLSKDSDFVKRCVAFLDLFRPRDKWYVKIDIDMNLPVSAGLASSACGFASLTLALKSLFAWDLTEKHLSILARLGSGSAARSLWNGFVEWHAGVQADGMDCYAQPLRYEWPELCIGMLVVSDAPKKVSSREAMQRTVDTSVLYTCWPKKVARDLVIIRQAIHNKNFDLLAGAAESNALSMHATMLSSWPAICYSIPETLAAMQKIWALRKAGMKIYFTQDAGANLKILFRSQDTEEVQKEFPTLELTQLGVQP